MDKIAKIYLLILAIIISFTITELFIRFVIGYPVSGELIKVIGISGYNSYGKLYKPYSKYWNVEGGDKVFERNNVGLPGSDVIITDSTDYVLILGSSVVEAQQVPRNQMATSVLQSMLEKKHNQCQVINLGTSGINPYQQWFRMGYFENLYEPNMVIMILDEHSYEYLSKVKIKNFNFPNQFGEKYEINLIKQITNFLKNNFSTFNIFLQNIYNLLPKPKQSIKEYTEYDVDISLTKLEICISEFQKKYKKRFILVSTLNDKPINSQIKKICINKKIIFFSDDSIQKPKNRFNNTGHLNMQGNKELGVLLYEVFKRNFIE